MNGAWHLPKSFCCWHVKRMSGGVSVQAAGEGPTLAEDGPGGASVAGEGPGDASDVGGGLAVAAVGG